MDTGAICSCQDYNSLLDRTIVVDYTIDAGDTDSTEIGTLLTTYLPGISTGQIDAINSSMEAVTLLGTFRDCMAKIAGQAKGSVHFWIDFQKQFYYVASRQDIAGAGGNVTLSDTLGGGNDAYGDTRYIQDNTRKVNRVYVQGDGVAGWVGSGTYQAIINDNSVKTADAVTELGTTITTNKGSATSEYHVTTWEPDAYGELYLTFAHSDFHSSATIDVRRATMTPRSTDGTQYTITLELGEFSVDTDNIGGGSSRGVLTPGGSRGGGIYIETPGSPDDAQYVVLALDADLSAERVLVDGEGITLTDSGANGNATLDLTWGTPTIGTIEPDDAANAGTSTNPARSDHQHAIAAAAPTGTITEATANAEGSASSFARSDHTHDIDTSGTRAPDDAQYVVLALDGDLDAERVLTAGDGLDLTDGGANGNVTLAVDVTDIIGNGITESSNNIVLGTPSTLTVSTSNGVTASSHTHAITSSSAPGAAASILATDASGIVYPRGVVFGTADADLNGNDLWIDADKDSRIYASADDEIDFALGGNRQYNFDHDQLTIYNTSGVAKCYIRTHGGTQTTGADLYAEEFVGIAGEESAIIFVDAANNGTGDRFAVMRNGENVSAATEVARIQENGLMGLNVVSPSAVLDVSQTSASGAAPVLYVRQSDVSEEFIRFRGTAAAGVLTRSIVDYGDESTSTAAVWLKVYVVDDGNQVTDTSYHILAYTLA